MSDKLEHIDDFFKGELNAEQLGSFEKRILEDPEFAEALSFYISFTQMAKGGIDEQKKERFRQLYNDSKGRAKRSVNLWPYLSAAASVVIILIAVYFFYPNPSPGSVAQTYIDKKLTTLPVTMGSTADSVQAGVRLYNEGKLNEAGELFTQILKTNPDNYKVTEYAGIVSLRMKNYDNAITYFEHLAKATHLYANKGNFYVALTLLKRNAPGDMLKAKALLKRIVDERQASEDEARALLRQL